ncbi:MAG: D-alanine--D-alanine ligase family protein [Candidatus Taylorbacteria bacterium]
MSKIRVGVLRGGPSSEYDVSLKTGGSVLKNMPGKFQTQDILITKDGVWHMAGVRREPHEIFPHVDVVFNALHGEYGEDGKVQQLLEAHSIPFTGSGAFASAIAMNKVLAKEWFLNNGLKTPLHLVVQRGEDRPGRVIEIFKTFPHPSIVKPAGTGSSVGVNIAYSIADLGRALKEALKYSDKALIEEFIPGREATCGVIENWRGMPVSALLPIEIVKPSESKFFDYQAKYGGGSKEICPGNFGREETALIAELAVKAHKALGLRHYSRSDFIVTPRRGIYILETNTLPGLTEESLFPKALHAVGSNLPEFLDHLIMLALEKK